MMSWELENSAASANLLDRGEAMSSSSWRGGGSSGGTGGGGSRTKRSRGSGETSELISSGPFWHF